ncbi:MarR family winged helix-turn-helix transcriptional regulator [Candidatus Protochlamydia phocaeensis]|uniref:MarR family winged helix-turn-helix transcriptional regulator n=1 Tax=Candidatus Protochlamydia phocaeensis TaxID=1414722 RepID=UPI00083901F7|nr:helix-turn-helix domain-containing protein [Candidatus Protochlamydia phocaeensis]
MQAAFAAKLEKASISIPEWCILFVLFHDRQATPAWIAEQVGIDRAIISRTVEKLVKRSYIRRGRGADRRLN